MTWITTRNHFNLFKSATIDAYFLCHVWDPHWIYATFFVISWHMDPWHCGNPLQLSQTLIWCNEYRNLFASLSMKLCMSCLRNNFASFTARSLSLFEWFWDCWAHLLYGTMLGYQEKFCYLYSGNSRSLRTSWVILCKSSLMSTNLMERWVGAYFRSLLDLQFYQITVASYKPKFVQYWRWGGLYKT